jgi:hypothetical protein
MDIERDRLLNPDWYGEFLKLDELKEDEVCGRFSFHADLAWLFGLLT